MFMFLLLCIIHYLRLVWNSESLCFVGNEVVSLCVSFHLVLLKPSPDLIDGGDIKLVVCYYLFCD